MALGMRRCADRLKTQALNAVSSALGVLERRVAPRAAIDVGVPRGAISPEPAGGAVEQGHLDPLLRQSTSRHKEPSRRSP